MARISSGTIDEISARGDIVALVGDYVRLENRGGDYWGCCPFHNEKTASFHVLPDRKLYHCFGCGKGGGIITFFMEMEKVSFAEAVEHLAKKYAVEVIYEGGFISNKKRDAESKLRDDLFDLYKRVSAMYHFFLLQTEQGKKALTYLKNRGVSDDMIEKFCLGYSPADRYWLRKFLKQKNYSPKFLDESGLFSKKYRDVSFFSDRLMFPIHNRKGQVVAFGGRLLDGNGPKYLNSGEMLQYKKGETLFAFNLAKNDIRNQKAVIICEGYMDVIAYHQAGICWAIAPLGTSLTEDQIQILRPFVDTVYLSFDGDEAGINATFRAVLLCRKANLSVRIIRISTPVTDLPEEALSAQSAQSGTVLGTQDTQDTNPNVMTQGATADAAPQKPKPKDPADILLFYGAKALTSVVNNSIIDADYLLSILTSKYPVDTPEGKTKAALEFFPYIDALSSDIQKESCLEQLANTLGMKMQSVVADFSHREQARKRTETADKTPQSDTEVQRLKKNAQLRAMLAVVANPQFFTMMRSALTVDDFEEQAAKELFFILEECFREDAVSFEAILAKCTDENLKKLVSETVTSSEFSLNSQKAIEDSIKMIRRNSLEKKRARLTNKIRQWSGSTLEEFNALQNMQYEKMTIDNELKDTNE